MTDTMLDFDRLHTHRDDPDTSHLAASNVQGTEAVKLAILTLLREHGGLTAFEAQDIYLDQAASRGWPIVQGHSINRRMSDMHKEVPARVRDTGVRRSTPSGATAVVWAVNS